LVIDTARQLHFHAAKVISNSLSKPFNTIFIDKGTKHHFYEDMGVINDEGVVGVVRSVSDNYATITPILNRNFNINAKIKGSGYFGNLSWDGQDPNYAQLTDIPNHISPIQGDTIISSGYSQIFKEGHIIGYIHQVIKVPGKSFINLDGIIQPSPAPRFSETKTSIPKPAPEIGQDNNEILINIGYSKDQVDNFLKNGIVK
jgi:rod shape-determining protein MreC